MQKTITHSCRPWLWQALISVMLTTMSFGTVFAQEKQLFVRVAKIVIDSAHIEEYNAALREGMEAAVSKEPGVLTLYAVYDKGHPTHVTVFEIYADAEAYRAHMETPHFKKYKAAVAGMVKSLELTDVVPIALDAKPRLNLKRHI